MTKNKFNIFTGIFLWGFLFLTGCQKNNTTIAKNRVGMLTNQTKIKAIKTLFKNDSIVKRNSEGTLGNNDLEEVGHIYIFDKKTHKKMLRITPENMADETSNISNIMIYDARFTTENGTHINSPFEKIRLQEKITKTGVTFTKVLLYLDDINGVISLKKSDLKINSYDLKKVRLAQIPDKATPQNIQVWFDAPSEN